MKHIQVNCSSCNRELKIKVAKGENAPDTTTCKACSQDIPTKEARRYIKTGIYKRK